MDGESVAENAYFNIIERAREYVYITTPYLILDHEMLTALCLAAKSGVDVRIITPGIPDKWYVYYVTQSYYAPLLRAGVRIYEYTPGFLHAKMYVSDDKVAIVGSANMDYRSLYLHFENCAVFYAGHMVHDVKADMTETLRQSREVTLDDVEPRAVAEDAVPAALPPLRAPDVTVSRRVSMELVVIDGQGGGYGRALIAALRAAGYEGEIIAVGTNSAATSAMLKAGADAGATGENAVIVNARRAEVIAGPLGLVMADSMAGRVQPRHGGRRGREPRRQGSDPGGRSAACDRRPALPGRLPDSIADAVRRILALAAE